jgi:hypothetical protein
MPNIASGGRHAAGSKISPSLLAPNASWGRFDTTMWSATCQFRDTDVRDLAEPGDSASRPYRGQRHPWPLVGEIGPYNIGTLTCTRPTRSPWRGDRLVAPPHSRGANLMWADLLRFAVACSRQPSLGSTALVPGQTGSSTLMCTPVEGCALGSAAGERGGGWLSIRTKVF